MTDAKPLSKGRKIMLSIPPMSVEQIKQTETAWENIYSRDKENFRTSYEPSLLATIRRRDVLIRHSVEIRGDREKSCSLCQEIQAIVDAGHE